MKNLTKLLIGLLLSGIIFTGCKEAEELTDVVLPVEYETDIDVTVTPGSINKATTGVFAATQTIDPTSDSDYKKYIDKIKSITVKEFSAEIISVNPNITLVSTVLSVVNETYNATWEFNNLDIVVGTIITLSNDNGQWDAINDIMLDKKVFTVNINGVASEDNADFVVRIILKSEIVANPL